MSLPWVGAGQLLRSVGHTAAVLSGTVSAAWGLLPRVPALLGQVEALLGQVEALLPRLQALLGSVEAVAGSAERAAARTHAVIDGADAAVARTNATLSGAEASMRHAQRMLGSTTELVGRADSMLTQFEQPLGALLPSLRRFADTLDPGEVEAAVALIDRLPDLLRHVEDDLLPMLRTLDRVGPDVHEILEVVEDLRRVLSGLPGVGLLRRRAESEHPRPDVTSDGHRRG